MPADRIPCLGRAGSAPDAHGSEGYSLLRWDPKCLLSREDAEQAAILVRPALAAARTTEHDGLLGVHAAVLGPVLRIIAEDAVHKVREGAHQVSKAAGGGRRMSCVRGADEVPLP